jgi:hypothetical protein
MWLSSSLLPEIRREIHSEIVHARYADYAPPTLKPCEGSARQCT